MLIKAQSQSLTGQLVERFAARQQGVSPHTVVVAYDQLLAQGLVQSRKNRGFFVREAPGRVLADNVTVPIGLSHATALIRAMFHGVSAKPQPGMGVFPPDWLAAEFMSAALRKVVRSRGLQSF